MRRFALIGDARIAHSPSPALHDAIFGAGAYGLMVDDDAEHAFAIAEQTLRGVNVTAPHKQKAAARYASCLDDDARRAGAVNTVVFGDGRAIVAANTDVHGVKEAWRRGNVIVHGRTVAVIGAGGAARAVVIAANDAGADRTVVVARNSERARALTATGATVSLPSEKADVVVIAASALDDVAGWIERTAKEGAVVHDLRYGAAALATRNAALSRRSIFLDGTTMLLAQGLKAAELFAGRPLTAAECDAARDAVRVCLSASASHAW